MNGIVAGYAGAAHAVHAAVAAVPDDVWEQPGLGEWTVRDLVGHASRSLVTVVEYLVRPVDHEVLASAADYLTAVATTTLDPAAIVERGRRAGRDLGPDPAARFGELVEEAVDLAGRTDPGLVVHTILGGMRVAAYLPTRTFELCVHGLDLAAATGVPLSLPPHALEEAASLAAVAAVRGGRGPDLLLALTGRRALPDGFSVV